ncbi:sugar ABC transporter substrate-binding protein [Vallitalea pronyensis]|uniref:Sugar ABC transporter substrate-binding protein n=1 Tax=Vallitalea pronyensis TaxID=1348613 RepID=A0A8J8MJL6_9FIRM|nr:sugar ABC transporter substrate-binding protein [Vallitalea pronyensis]QUI22488.1 sugar ABC transporter substrate-binding protein [Vallitalea pronyensis]
MRKKIVILLSLVIMMGVIFTGCNKKETSSADTQDEKVTLGIWWASQDEFKAPLLEAIREFEEANPQIKIEPEWMPNFDYYDKYKIALTGDQAPDIVKIDHVFVQSLGYNGQVFDLAEFGADKIKDQFIQSTWDANMYKEHVYALPFDANTLALMYNKDILDKAGVMPPTTLEQLIASSQAVSELGEEGVYGYTIPFDPGKSGFLSFQFTSWIARNGGSILSDDWSKATLNSPEVIQALKQVKSLIDTKAAPANAFMENEFYAGKIGMLEMGPWHVPTITSPDAPANFGIVPVVSLKEGVDTYAPLGLYSLAIAKQSKHPEEAYKFIEFLATHEKMQIAYSKTTNLMPTLKEAYKDEFYDNDVWKIFITQLEKTVSRPGSPAWPLIDEAISDAIQEVLTDTKSPEDALKNAEEKINKELEKLQ